MIEARPRGVPFRYRLACNVDDEGVRVEGTTPGLEEPKTLLYPYLRDAGGPFRTELEMRPGEVRFHHAAEVVALRVSGEVERMIDIPYGYENRRGRCGMLRVDLRGRRAGVEYRLAID